jgi:hypothetical protein
MTEVTEPCGTSVFRPKSYHGKGPGHKPGAAGPVLEGLRVMWGMTKTLGTT